MPKPKVIKTEARAFRVKDERIDKWLKTLPYGSVSEVMNLLLERHVKELEIDFSEYEKEIS